MHHVRLNVPQLEYMDFISLSNLLHTLRSIMKNLVNKDKFEPHLSFDFNVIGLNLLCEIFSIELPKLYF